MAAVAGGDAGTIIVASRRAAKRLPRANARPRRPANVKQHQPIVAVPAIVAATMAADVAITAVIGGADVTAAVAAIPAAIPAAAATAAR
jgi:hypothetical protein